MVIIMFWVFFVFCFVVGLCVLPFFFFYSAGLELGRKLLWTPLRLFFWLFFFYVLCQSDRRYVLILFSQRSTLVPFSLKPATLGEKGMLKLGHIFSRF